MDLIKKAAIEAAGGDAMWNTMDRAIQNQYLALAEKMATVLVGKPVPWNIVELTARVELTKHSGSLTKRRADSTMLDRIARNIVDAMKLSRDTVIHGHEDKRWGGHFFGDAKADEPPLGGP